MQKTVLKPRTETALLSEADPLCKLLRQTIHSRPFPLLKGTLLYALHASQILIAFFMMPPSHTSTTPQSLPSLVP